MIEPNPPSLFNKQMKRKLHYFLANLIDQIPHDEYREPTSNSFALFYYKKTVPFNWINRENNSLIFFLKLMRKKNRSDEKLSILQKICSEEKPSELISIFKKENNIEEENLFSICREINHYRMYTLETTDDLTLVFVKLKDYLQNAFLTSIDFKEVILQQAHGNNILIFLDLLQYESSTKRNRENNFTNTPEKMMELVKTLRNVPYRFLLLANYDNFNINLFDWGFIYKLKFIIGDNVSSDKSSMQCQKFVLLTNFPIKKFRKDRSLLEYVDIKIKISNLCNPEKKQNVFDTKEVSIRSPVRYPGSKAQAIRFIQPFWEKAPHDEYREPFLGGGAVFFFKPKVKYNWINDLDKELMITFKIMADPIKRHNICDVLGKERATKERFIEIKNQNPSTDLEIAIRYFYLNRTAYSGIMNKPNWGYSDEKSVPPNRWPKRIVEAGKKLEGVKTTHVDYHEVIEAPKIGKDVFMFVDPPYFEADQKRAYSHSFSEDDHLELCEVLNNTPFRFCLTYDDCQSIREMYSWATLHPRSWRYHTANARKATRKMGYELIITNF